MTPVAADSILTIVGAYARFSNDGLQRDSSIDDQFTTCNQAAEEKGWVYDPSLQFSDAGLSGALMSTREGLQALLKPIESDKTKSYHGFMFDDTSRLGRNLSEVLQFCKLCQFHGVFLYFVNQQLDSRDSNFYELIKNYASSDENFLKSLGHAVIRGQKGRIKAGMIHGGRYYGYKGEAILDPLKRSTASRKAIKGVKLVIDEVEAEVVRTVYRWAEEGHSLMHIVRECIASNFPRPERKKRAKTIWTMSAVSQILHSNLYCGYLSYGKSTNAKHPVTGRVENRSTDKSKWTEVHFPDLAIVTVEQWERVQAISKTRTDFGAHRLGGMGRRDQSAPIPLFSGLLVCGSCGGAYVVTNKNFEGDRVLQCKNYRFYKTCDSPLTLIEPELEQRLIDYIVNRLLVPQNLNFALERFQTELNARIATEELQRKGSQASKKKSIREQSRLELELKNIINSLREIGPEESLKSEFQRIQGRLNLIKNELQENITPKLNPISPEDAYHFVNSLAEQFSELLLANRVSAQRVIRQFIGPLTVSRHPGGHLPMCRIQGGLRVCNLNEDVMPSDTGSRTLRHYGEFQMIIDVVVPARTPQMNYLHHPECNASTVADMIRAGKSALEIARALGVSRFKVGKVIEFLDMAANPLRVDYLNHPRCPAETTMQLRNAGHTFEEIGEHLGISHELVRKVLRTYSKAKNIPMLPAKAHRGQRKSSALALPRSE